MAVQNRTRCLVRVGALMLVRFGRIVFGAASFHNTNALYPEGERPH
jgi:hypothetical protein